MALDPQQERLRTELRIDGIEYHYRQDEIEFSGPLEFGFTEAAISLACGNADVDFSTHAKREVGKLWENIQTSPYKALFNAELSSRYLWSVVQLQRQIDEQIKLLTKTSEGRDHKILVHGNRLVSHFVHRKVALKHNGTEVQSVTTPVVLQHVASALVGIRTGVDTLFPENYLQSLFKNMGRVRGIKANSGL